MCLLGKQERWITQLAFGIDDRKVIDAKSISREITFQQDVDHYGFLEDILLLLALCVEDRARRTGLYGNGVSLKITYANMKTITRSRSVFACNCAVEIYREAVQMLRLIDKLPVRLIGAGIYNLSMEEGRQLTIEELLGNPARLQEAALKKELEVLRQRYRLDFAGHLEQLYHVETLHKTVEYMRKRIRRLDSAG